MSQVLLGKPKNTILYSEMYFPRKREVLHSSAVEASCYLCKQELKEGIGLTAKRIGNKTVLICGLH